MENIHGKENGILTNSVSSVDIIFHETNLSLFVTLMPELSYAFHGH